MLFRELHNITDIINVSNNNQYHNLFKVSNNNQYHNTFKVVVVVAYFLT